ncbi:peptidoglycan-binding domain-containing protein [Actinoplanes sp. CA-015351]|uniref:peptidoglycan-binding domain-containing protein n=1 Tax=Actinoplanes sp. CA-015351 TaxID=3239897 RepID=UPI003D95E797
MSSEEKVRRRVGLVVALTAVVSTVSTGGTILILGDRVTSQAEAIANAQAVTSEPVVVAVEERELNETFSFRANVDDAAQASLRLTPGIEGVITRVRLKAGGTVRAGGVPLEVEGRPVIALPGRFRAYRDIVDGDTGPDVEQLQDALRELGYRVRDADGVYGKGTQTALGKLYRHVGWEPPYQVQEQPAEPEQNPAPLEASATPAASATPKKPSTVRTIAARADELFILASLPRPVDRVDVRIGQTAAGADTVLSRYTAATRLRGTVAANRSEALEEGTRVTVDVDGTEVGGEITTADRAEAGNDGSQSNASGDEVPVAVVLDKRRTLGAGRSYKVTVEGRHTDGEVLVVPVMAVNERVDGTAFVTVRKAGDPATNTDVEVIAGVQSDGWVEVAPDDPAALPAGTPVIVGGETP